MYKKDLNKSKIILLKGENGRKLVETSLIKNNYNISIIECYKKVFKIINNHVEIKKWRSYKINTLVVTSGELLKRLNEIVDISNKQEWLFKCKIFVVGNRLSRIAQKIGWRDIIISNYANNKNLLNIIKKYN
ncbi:uroporphyrinogen-III synthase [Buchnera aphidicola]|uniref:uroporphyrinogen-III synthase n=1 Tax=Buchnera aphidicola TaxID=9 RepID=UPI0021C85884|nr:uroporphyrinogen-III synthase [Buchnera aphidicola]